MFKRLLALAGALCLLALPAFSQTNPTGTVSGKIADQQGLAVPGAVITAQSPALQGTRSATSSANGDFILPFLPPGDYTLTADMPGFRSTKQRARVVIAQTTTVSFALVLSSVTETIEVTAATAADFGQKAQASTNFKQDLVEKLPLARTFRDAALLTPGVQATGPQGALAISGAMSYQNLFMINGVVVQDNVRSTPFNLFIEDALQETTTSTAAVSAEYGRFGGGVVNAITKSGGNNFSGSYRMTLENDKWTALTPYPNDKRTDKVIPIHEATLGGPLLKDKLWFFGAARLRDSKETRTTSATNLNYQRELNEKRYEGKLTFSPTAKHTFKTAYSNINSAENGNVYSSSVMDLASLVNRTTPQSLLSVNYTGVLSSNFFVEAQYSGRKYTFENSGSMYTDRIKGTLLLDRSRGNNRYNSPTFCGVCGPEHRDNQNVVAKASYFLSTKSTGSHNLVAGLDMFDDKRKVNNHQSGSDFRIYTTSAILQPDGTVVPVLDGKSFIRWTPIFEDSKGNNFRTVSAFVNDAWTYDHHFSFNLGLRYDKNDGVDASGNKTVKDAAWSPRLSATLDPKGDGAWTVNASYAKYVTAIANTVGDSAAVGGQPATIDFDYLGPAVNTGDPTNPLSTAQALQILWDWFDANGGTNRPIRGTPSVPGVNYRIGDRLVSPSVREFALGFTRKLGTRGLVRVDGVYRKYGDFYSARTSIATGKVADRFGKIFDLSIGDNTNDVERKYKGLNLLLNYKPVDRLNIGANYTLGRTEGNVDGESGTGGPTQSGIHSYPEYFDVAWSYSYGGLATDVRHRARLYSTFRLPLPSALGSFDLGGIYVFNTGSPYGVAGSVDTRPYVTNPGYVNPPSSVTYWFQPRDAYRTADTHRVDLSLNWGRRLGMGNSEVFFRTRLLNVFNRDALTNTQGECGTTGCLYTSIDTNNNKASLAPFNPFTTAPVEGTNWMKATGATAFGTPRNRFAYQTPRTYDFSFGVRF